MFDWTPRACLILVLDMYARLAAFSFGRERPNTNLTHTFYCQFVGEHIFRPKRKKKKTFTAVEVDRGVLLFHLSSLSPYDFGSTLGIDSLEHTASR